MFIYTCIWFQITFSVTYNPLVWRAVMMPNVDNMLSIGYLGSYSFAGLKQDEINPEDQPPSSHDWEKKEWSIELGFFIHWQILKQNQEWEQWKFSSIFDFNKWNVTFCLYVFFLYLLLSMLTQWCDGCQYIRSNTKIQANNWKKNYFKFNSNEIFRTQTYTK